MGAKLVGDWAGAPEKIAGWAENLRKRLAARTLKNCIFLVGKIQEGIVSQAPGGVPFPPLHAYTVAMRLAQLSNRYRQKVLASPGGAKRLINHGDLLGAITYEVGDDGLSGAVGINRKAKSQDGAEVVNIAKVQTNGAVIAVTPKMRAYLHATGLHLRADTTHVIIPPAPFVEPVFKQYKEQLLDGYREDVRAAIKGR